MPYNSLGFFEHIGASVFTLNHSDTNQSAFWGINKLGRDQLQPIAAILNEYSELIARHSQHLAAVNYRLFSGFDLVSLGINRPPFTTIADNRGRVQIWFEPDKPETFRLDLGLPTDQTPEQLADGFVSLLMDNPQAIRKDLAVVFRKRPQILRELIEVNIQKEQAIDLLNGRFAKEVAGYYRINESSRIDLRILHGDRDSMLNKVREGIWQSKPADDSRYARLAASYNPHAWRGSGSFNIATVNLRDPAEAEKAVMQILDKEGLLDNARADLRFFYNEGRKQCLIDHAAPLLECLSGLPKDLVKPIREIFAAYIFDGIQHSEFSDDPKIESSIMLFTDKEFAILLKNQIDNPVSPDVCNAYGDYPVTRERAFNRLAAGRDQMPSVVILGLKDLFDNPDF